MYNITAIHPTFKAGKNAGKINENRLVYNIEGTTEIPVDVIAATAAISAYAITTTGAEIPELVTAFDKVTWQAARSITSLKKLKALKPVAALELNSADINFLVAMLTKKNTAVAGGLKISAKNTAIQLLLEVLYCKQNNINYTCKARKVSEKNVIKSAEKTEKTTKSKKNVTKSTVKNEKVSEKKTA